jgi:hypothetical protein
LLIDVRTTVPAFLVALVATGLVVVRVAGAPGPTPRRAATAEERAALAKDIRTLERGWSIETTQNFPSDHWSQRDDFHGRELRRAIEIANQHGVRIEDVLRAVDDDIHLRRATEVNASDQRNARAIPCKPRPFYD